MGCGPAKKFDVKKCNIGELNPKGVERLCQAVLASGIKELDEDFINDRIVYFYLDNGFREGTFGITKYRKIFIDYKNQGKKSIITTSEKIRAPSSAA